MYAGQEITMGNAVTICLFSLITVFVVLFAISFMIDIMAAIINKSKKKSETVATPAPAAAPVVSASAAPSSSNDAVLVAAAVAAYLGLSTDQFVVRSIRRVTNTETSWSQVGRTGSVQ